MPDTWAHDVGALISYLLAQSEVAALVGTRVFGMELPDVEATSMPRKCVLINSAGAAVFGMAARSEIPLDSRTKDVRCYGETPYEASRVYNAVNLALKRLRRRLVTPPGGLGAVLLYSATKIGGPAALREPETEWPVLFSSYNVLVADAVA